MRTQEADYSALLEDPRWQNRRLEILRRDNWTCRKCGSTKSPQVHHKFYEFGKKPWEYDDDVLETLCKLCHYGETTARWRETGRGADGTFITDAFATAKRSEPLAAARYVVPGVRLIVSLCCVLQRAAGDRPFYLGCRDAGRLTEVTFSRAAKWLRRLVYDGVLELVSKGTKANGMASQYLYRGEA